MDEKYKKKLKILTIISIVGILLGVFIQYFLNNKNELNLYDKQPVNTVDNLNNNSNENITNEEIFVDNIIGYLTIPVINLYNIPIRESVELETLSKSIGHFENTNIYNGNVGLASHNAGTNANYFENIHKLQKGNEIHYKTKYGIKIYAVESISEINSYDWSKLEETNVNQITLITCISGKSDFRLCVQANEILK